MWELPGSVVLIQMHGINGDKWLVVFCDPLRNPDLFGALGDAASLHSRAVSSAISWCKPGFRHVFAMRPAACGWLVVDNRANGVGIIEAPPEYIGIIRQYEAAGCVTTIDVMASLPTGPQGFLGLGVLSCVHFIRRLLGVRCRAVTPYGLYRHLKGLRHGFTV